MQRMKQKIAAAHQDAYDVYVGEYAGCLLSRSADVILAG